MLQSEAAECGLACLAMVAGYHGHRVTLSELRRRHAVSLKGTTLKTLIAIADALGFTSRPLRLELDDLPKLKRPCVLHWDLAHYVVLSRVTPRWVEVHDPASGLRRLTHAEVSKHFTGVLTMTPTRCVGLSALGGGIIGGAFGAFGGPAGAYAGASVGLIAGGFIGGFFCPSNSPTS